MERKLIFNIDGPIKFPATATIGIGDEIVCKYIEVQSDNCNEIQKESGPTFSVNLHHGDKNVKMESEQGDHAGKADLCDKAVRLKQGDSEDHQKGDMCEEGMELEQGKPTHKEELCEQAVGLEQGESEHSHKGDSCEQPMGEEVEHDCDGDSCEKSMELEQGEQVRKCGTHEKKTVNENILGCHDISGSGNPILEIGFLNGDSNLLHCRTAEIPEHSRKEITHGKINVPRKNNFGHQRIRYSENPIVAIEVMHDIATHPQGGSTKCYQPMEWDDQHESGSESDEPIRCKDDNDAPNSDKPISFQLDRYSHLNNCYSGDDEAMSCGD